VPRYGAERCKASVRRATTKWPLAVCGPFSHTHLGVALKWDVPREGKR
jgi:hypothetical protein